MKEVTYKCNHTVDPETKEHRKECSQCILNRYLFEQGLKYVALKDEEPNPEYICPHTDEKLVVKNIRELSQKPNVIVKMTLEEVKKDRKMRSSSHFQKEILPTLGKDEQRHHKNKK